MESGVCCDQPLIEILRNKCMNLKLSSSGFLYFYYKRYFVLVLLLPRFVYNGIEALGRQQSGSFFTHHAFEGICVEAA